MFTKDKTLTKSLSEVDIDILPKYKLYYKPLKQHTIPILIDPDMPEGEIHFITKDTKYILKNVY